MRKGQICVSLWRDGTETQQSPILQTGALTYIKGTTQMNEEEKHLFGGSQKVKPKHDISETFYF